MCTTVLPSYREQGSSRDYDEMFNGPSPASQDIHSFLARFDASDIEA